MARLVAAILPYVQIARPDHWFKNVFMLLGVLLAVFYEPSLIRWSTLVPIAIAVVATCLVASSNYVMNEILDAPYDRMHPVKRFRPVPSGRVVPIIGWVEWIALAIAGIAVASSVNWNLALSATALWIAGIAYNVPPIRTKELPYLDVLSESINNPLRLFLGWFALVPDKVPPVSLSLAYWMAGAFFMATKRFAECRSVKDPVVLAAYRKSFAYYTEDRLLVSMFFYALTCSLFSGIFIVRYHFELILFVPVAAGILAYYLKLGLQPDSPAQNPERLIHDKGFMLFLVASLVFFVLLMFTRFPALYEVFNVEPSSADPLWTIGR